MANGDYEREKTHLRETILGLYRFLHFFFDNTHRSATGRTRAAGSGTWSIASRRSGAPRLRDHEALDVLWKMALVSGDRGAEGESMLVETYYAIRPSCCA